MSKSVLFVVLEARELQEEQDFLKPLRCLQSGSVFRPYVDSHAKRLVTIHQIGEAGETNSPQVQQRPDRGIGEGQIEALFGNM